ncbi:hypothetical protein EAI_06056 [Harpegnathos saltator]|uniref:Uncharacterized protein n=1 Tax=Harpegnathos saltator TaxID=610380 RepID=E2B4A7_HARSA|nr:hypothetical protein EAI_06056 [Harpegnathos saltator]
MSKENVDTENITNSAKKKKLMETEYDLKILRLKNIIEKEKQLKDIQIKHEEKLNAMKENHLKEINNLELRAYLAQAKLAELLLVKEEDAQISNKANML